MFLLKWQPCFFAHSSLGSSGHCMAMGVSPLSQKCHNAHIPTDNTIHVNNMCVFKITNQQHILKYKHHIQKLKGEMTKINPPFGFWWNSFISSALLSKLREKKNKIFVKEIYPNKSLALLTTSMWKQHIVMAHCTTMSDICLNIFACGGRMVGHPGLHQACCRTVKTRTPAERNLDHL